MTKNPDRAMQKDAATRIARIANSTDSEMLPVPFGGTALGRSIGTSTSDEIASLDVTPYIEKPEEWMFLRLNVNIKDNPVLAYQLSGMPVTIGRPIEEQVEEFMSIPRIRQAIKVMERRTTYIGRVIDRDWCVEKLVGAMIQAEAYREVTPQISAITKIAEIRGFNAPIKVEGTDEEKKELLRLERAKRIVDAAMSEGEEKKDRSQEIIAQVAEIIEE
jgi:hypothetical protein